MWKPLFSNSSGWVATATTSTPSLNQADRAMLQFTGGIGLRMDVAISFSLGAALHADGVIQPRPMRRTHRAGGHLVGVPLPRSRRRARAQSDPAGRASRQSQRLAARRGDSARTSAAMDGDPEATAPRAGWNTPWSSRRRFPAPAQVPGSALSASRAIDEPTTLTPASVRTPPPCQRSAARLSSRFAALADDNHHPAFLQNRVAVAEFARQIDLAGDARRLFRT